ncbi:MAG: tripartite tricarboxylate transporter substrate binding protein, partial [Alphaproteobacteria bacterium]|nr:tripartite tricarboxylate transporter substrate binding protein [Alphaproteobacteria bacterium]
MAIIFNARRVLTLALGVAAGVMGVAAGSQVQWKPDKRVTVLVAYQAGGGADGLARLMVEAISKERGWSIIIENKVGAGGGIMLTQLNRSAPDGLTVGVAATGSISVAPLFVTSLKYGPRDFTYLGTMAKTQMAMIAGANAPYNTLEEFAAFARKKGNASVAVMGPEIGLVARLIARHYKIDLSIVPTKGGAETLTQSAAGHVDAAFNAGAHHGLVQEGKLKVIANLNDTPLVLTPKAKSLRESGIDYVSNVFFQVQGPPGMPPEIQRAWAEAIDSAIKSPAYLKIARDRMLM